MLNVYLFIILFMVAVVEYVESSRLVFVFRRCNGTAFLIPFPNFVVSFVEVSMDNHGIFGHIAEKGPISVQTGATKA